MCEVEKLHEIIRTNDPENYTHEEREPSPRGVMHDGWHGELIPHAACLRLARPGGCYVPDPLAISSIGKRNEESLRCSKNIPGVR